MPAKHYVALDSWRGIAALLVTLHHFVSAGAATNSLLVRNSWLFVDFFFVLSGFIIAANYRDRLHSGAEIGRFMTLRFGRLYPLHLAMLLAWIAVEAALALFASSATTAARPPFSGAANPAAIPAQLLLLQSIGFGFNETWNRVAWSISAEFWTYLVFAALVLSGAARLDRRLALLAGGAALFILLAPPKSDAAFRWLDLARCVYGFCIGALLLTVTRLPASRAWQAAVMHMPTLIESVALGVVAAFVIYCGRLPGGATTVHLLAPLAFGTAVFAFAYDGGAISRALATPAVARLGVLSYSLYMIHPFLQLWVFRGFGLVAQKISGIPLFTTMTSAEGVAVQAWGATPLMGDMATLCMVVVVIAVAELTYRLIEAPGRMLARRWVGG
jgi:peptidoglycan/LPS O-acetylase OafA/YrhL